MDRRITAVITAITGDRIVVGEDEFNHSKEKHFPMIPADMLLELIERILKDPTKIFEEKKTHEYHLFYKLEDRTYLVVIVKKTNTGNYFSSMYNTGDSIRHCHKNLKEIAL